ncbi:MAG: dTMP kinase [Pseudomonadota bacterium]
MKRLKNGLFLAFEGIDGAGKTTQAFRLKARLEKEGFGAVYVKEPTDGFWGRKIRAIARNGRAGVAPEEELSYFIRDREEDVRQNIAPALDRGQVVIADRYFYSTICYQSVLGLDPVEIRRLNLSFPVPDLVFILDISPRLSQKRITRLRNEEANLGYEQEEFLTKVKKVFDVLEDPNIVRLDGSADLEVLAEEIWRLTRGGMKFEQ